MMLIYIFYYIYIYNNIYLMYIKKLILSKSNNK